jgi:hypothetical protein
MSPAEAGDMASLMGWPDLQGRSRWGTPKNVPQNFTTSSSGSLGVPRSLHDLDPSPGRAFEVFLDVAPPFSRIDLRRNLRALAPLQRVRFFPEPRGSPLLGFVRVRPSVDTPPERSLPENDGCRFPSADRCQTARPVPPSWFHTTSTVCSARKLRVCCTPQPTMGFAAFPGSGSP